METNIVSTRLRSESHYNVEINNRTIAREKVVNFCNLSQDKFKVGFNIEHKYNFKREIYQASSYSQFYVISVKYLSKRKFNQIANIIVYWSKSKFTLVFR